MDILRYSEGDATLIYHAFTMLCYFFPLAGAIIADSYLGKYRYSNIYLFVAYKYKMCCLLLKLSCISESHFMQNITNTYIIFLFLTRIITIANVYSTISMISLHIITITFFFQPKWLFNFKFNSIAVAALG